MIKVAIKKVDICGTCLKGELDISYDRLVEIFGTPNLDNGDCYKTDANWGGYVDNEVFTIYNYKTGKNYNGADGLETKDIRDWHIGGRNYSVFEKISEYIDNFPAK